MAFFKLACCVLCCIGATDDSKLPLIADMDRDNTAFYNRFRESDSTRDKMNAIVDMCQLHNQVWSHPRYATIEKLRGMRNKIVFQLKVAQKEIRKTVEGNRNQKRAKSDNQPAAGESEFLSPGDVQSRASPPLEHQLIDALLLGLQYTPGPDQIAVHAGSFGGGDNGPELIALIQSTIHPEHWDINGGPGHIHYYRPVMALVVSAGSVTHDDMTDFLQRLRDSGQ